jgi:hypothetical protein
MPGRPGISPLQVQGDRPTHEPETSAQHIELGRLSQEVAALQDFGPAHVSMGSNADILHAIRNVRSFLNTGH